jgi:hypothetical protein
LKESSFSTTSSNFNLIHVQGELWLVSIAVSFFSAVEGTPCRQQCTVVLFGVQSVHENSPGDFTCVVFVVFFDSYLKTDN